MLSNRVFLLTVQADSPSVEVVYEAEEVMSAVASGDVDKSMLTNLWNAFLNFLPTIIVAAVIYVVGMIAVKIIMSIINKAMGRSRIEPTAQGFIKSLVKIILSAFTIIIALSALGVPMTSIITAIGAAGLAVGLALQNSLSNLAGGFLILYSKPFRKGDYISTNGVEGTVDDITILSTKLITSDNKVIYIPNGSVSGNTLVNYSSSEKRRVDLVFSISYESDFRKAEEVIRSVVQVHPKIIKDDEPTVRVSTLGKSSIDIVTRVWCRQPDYWNVYYDLIENVKTAFDSEGIEIPYDKLDVKLSGSIEK